MLQESTPENMKDIVFLVGPTAVGKTETSLHLAKIIDAEIISCDSMQIYKGMDIGTQKPTSSQLEQVSHHMIDIVSPSETFSVARFCAKTITLIKKIHKKDKVPLIVGGTALYMKALIDGLFPSPPADTTLRAILAKEEEIHGAGFLHKKLTEVDKETAQLLHPNDTRRIIRALEIYINTDVPMSILKKKTKGLADDNDIKVFCLGRQRSRLYKRIDERVNEMFKEGLVDECRSLKDKRLSVTAKKALGYVEVFDYLDSKMSLTQAKKLIKRNTRHFAKRQLSWFRNDDRIIWVDVDYKRPDVIAKKIGSLCMRSKSA
ncbi:tRNA (adenosine(37)-N6)-dimethylallyltransferase MiaA [Candidatus Omnitrophota bacterium]